MLRALINQADKKCQVPKKAENDSSVFTIKYYQELDQAKSFIRNLEPDIKRGAGDPGHKTLGSIQHQ